MSFIIENQSDDLIINITSNISSALSLSFKRNGTTQTAISSTINKGVHNWTIPLSNYSLGDTLSNFTVSITGKKPWELDEGVTILLDGKEYDNINTSSFTMNFDKADEYTIEAVYVGNDKLGMSSTGKKTFAVSQPSVQEQSPTQTGKYKLVFKNKNLSTLTYNDGAKVEFVLTQGGYPVIGKTIEKVTPKSILSSDTNKNGEVSFTNIGYNAGKYKIGAYFYDYQDSADRKIVDSTYKTITINKANPTIHYTGDEVKKGQKVGIFFRDNQGNRIVNEKVPIYLNGKLYTKTTNSNGNIWIKMTNTGTFKFKVAYKGNKNLNKKTVTFTKKIKR